MADAPAAPSPIATLSYLEFLTQRLEAMPKSPKRARTRERLRIATIEVLNERGYNAMRAGDITEAAALAEGSFYVYFKSKADITLDVLTEFSAEFMALGSVTSRGMSAFEAIQAVNRRWIGVATANPGLMRFILQTSNEVTEFQATVNRFNRIWHERVGAGVARRRNLDEHSGISRLVLYLLGGMTDEIVRRLIVYPDGELLEIMKEIGADNEAVADAASAIWFRVLYPNRDLNAELSPAASHLAGIIER